jgi:hypothetical protein
MGIKKGEEIKKREKDEGRETVVVIKEDSRILESKGR